jgi:hypothetical protein
MELPCVVLHVDPAEDILLERLRERAGDGKEGVTTPRGATGSDADEGIYRAVRGEFEPPGTEAYGAVVRTDGLEPMCDLVAAVVDALVGLRRGAP